MLDEYIITPDVFDSSSYEHQQVCTICLRYLKDELQNGAIVRDLREGQWFQSAGAYVNQSNMNSKPAKLLKYLQTEGRLRQVKSHLTETPMTCSEWCKEAIASFLDDPATGIVFNKSDKQDCKESKHAISVLQLHAANFWPERRCSVRAQRSIDHYLNNLKRLLQYSNSLMFIDPFIDPTQRNYQDFWRLIAEAKRKATIEIHRRIKDNGNDKKYLTQKECEERFADLMRKVNRTDLKLSVFVWDDFHDRYLISNLMGISLPYGFSTSNAKDLTTWTRLRRRDADDVQREFDNSSNDHILQFKFEV